MASASMVVDFIIPEEQVKFTQDAQDVLGEGACSRVVKAIWNGASVAVKSVRCEDEAKPDERRDVLETLRKELSTMCELRHPHVVRLFGVYAPGTRHVGLVMELMDMSLHSRTIQGPPLDVPCLIHVLHDMTSALAHLHSVNILHLDISPRNTLLSEDSAHRRLVAKLSDFATAKAVQTIGFDRYSATSGQIGTLSYLPYEAIDRDPQTDKLVYSSAVDVYSVGAVGLFAALQKVPGGTPRAKSGYLTVLGSDHVLHSLFKGCLNDDPRLRPASCDLLAQLEKLQDFTRAGCQRCYGATAMPKEAPPSESNTVEGLKAELSEVHKRLQASQLAEKESREAREKYEQLSDESAARERAAQEQLAISQKETQELREHFQTVEEDLSVTKQRLQIAEERTATVAKECAQLRCSLQEARSRQSEQVGAKAQLTTSPGQDTRPAKEAHSRESEQVGANTLLTTILRTGHQASQRSSLSTPCTKVAAKAPLTSQPGQDTSPAKASAPTHKKLKSYRCQSLADVPGDGKRCHQMVHFREWIVLLGGSSKPGKPCVRVYAYHLQSCVWAEWTTVPFRFSAAASDGQNLYIVGGLSRDSTEYLCSFYRLSDDRTVWLQMPNMQRAVSQCAAAYHKDKLYVCGLHSGGVTCCLQAFSFTKPYWSILSYPPLLINPNHQTGLVPWGDYLVPNTLTCCYDVISDKWHFLPKRNAGGTGSLAVINDELCAVGTFTIDASEDNKHAFDVLDGIHFSWSSFPSLSSPVVGASACAVGNKLFVAGGNNAASFICIL